VGHVEWAEFVRVPRLPRPGEIVHASERWEEPGGGGAVAAVQLAKLAGEATLFTALGDDEVGHRAAAALRALGLQVEAVFRPEAQRRVFVHVDGAGERTITVIGPRLVPRGEDALPWDSLARHDAVYLTAADAGAVRAARAARVLVATPRALAVLIESAVALDALVGSARDPGEVVPSGALPRAPALTVRTEGADGGRWCAADGRSGRFPAEPLPGPVADTYGAGDAFAAGLTFGLGHGLGREAALRLAARCGAAAVTGRGPYTAQLRLAGPPAPGGGLGR